MKLARAIFAVLIATAFATMFTFSASAADKDCKDFASQPDAQQYFVNGGGSADNNFNNLDHNHNGVACEDYDYSGGGGNSGGDVPVDNSGDVPADTTDNGDTSSDVPADTTDTTDVPAGSGEVATDLPNTGSGPTSGTDTTQIAVLAVLSLITLGAASQVIRRRNV